MWGLNGHDEGGTRQETIRASSPGLLRRDWHPVVFSKLGRIELAGQHATARQTRASP